MVKTYDTHQYHRLGFKGNEYKVNCGMKNVTDGIGEHFEVSTRYNYELGGYEIEQETVDRWGSKQPVFISAQTGRGKNYFVENALLPYIRELNHDKNTRQKVLILSNRIALSLQMKDRLKQGLLDQGEDDGEELYSYSQHNKNVLGAEYADVLSYQGFLNRLEELKKAQGLRKNKYGETKQKEASKYLFVICDEAHFFTSDSMFNPYTDRILQGITKTFKNAIRVYMTATPDECTDHILRYEKESFSPDYPEKRVLYDFKRDYDYLDIIPYSKIEELYEAIEGNDRENWLIFIDDIEKGRELREDLENTIDTLKHRVYAVSAKSKNETIYQEMVRDETINVVLKPKKEKEKARVLIATSVIDNGVNFRNIHNVVITDISKVKVLQMVGRARVDLEQGQRVTLYLKRPSEQEVKSRIDYMEKRKNCHHDFATSNAGTNAWFTEKYVLEDQDYAHKKKHWIGIEREKETKMFLNEIAVSQVAALIPHYKSILKEMKDEATESNEGDGLVGQGHLECMYGWFGKTYEKESDITLIGKDEAMNELISFLEKYVAEGTRMFKDTQGEFRKKFTELYDETYKRRDKNSPQTREPYGLTVINTALKDHSIGYKVESTQDKETRKTYWKVVRVDR